MDLKLSERVSTYLAYAEKSGELRKIEHEALSMDDGTRKQLAAELEALPSRDKSLAAATEVKLKALRELELAEVAWKKARARDDEATTMMRAAELGFDGKGAALRRALWEIAPSIAIDVRLSLDILRERVRGALLFWPTGNTHWDKPRYATNENEVMTCAGELNALKDEVTQLAFMALDFVTIEARCRDALAQGTQLASAFLDRDELRRALGAEIATPASEQH